MDENKIQLFEDKRIRTAWDEENEKWLFSIVDVVSVLTDQPTHRGASNYWAKLKQRLNQKGANQLLTNCQQLKMTAFDGKNVSLMSPTPNNFCALFSPFPLPKPNHSKCGSLLLGASVLKKPSIRN